MSHPLRLCKTCKAEKADTEFYKSPNRRDGLATECKSCCAKRCVRNRRASLPSNPRARMRGSFDSRLKRAKALGLPFSITIDDVLPVPEFCPVLGIRLEHNRGNLGPIDASPTIDRIVPAKGYVPGNVIVVSNKANRIKNDATVAELRRVLEFYERLAQES